MRLRQRYEELTTEQRAKLAADAGIEPPYLYQLATRYQGRRPSIEVMLRLVQADKKLKLTDLVAEFSEPAGKRPRVKAVA